MKTPSATIAASALLLVVAVGVGSALVLDVDNDGIPATKEFGDTNPLSSDTDGDGLADDVELDFGSDPTVADTDQDGLIDREEYYGTSPWGEGVDRQRAVFVWNRSDPRNTDTDGDGIEDGREVELTLNPTATDSDGDGLSDSREHEGPTDAVLDDTDGDNLLDGWEVHGETDKGADISAADPLHKDAFVQILYLQGFDRKLPESVFPQVKSYFADMAVQNPDGETGINVHFVDEQRVNRSIDNWVREDGTKTNGVDGFMAMREFYNRETIGVKTGSHFLVVVPGDDVPVYQGGSAGGTKTSIIRPYQKGYSSAAQTYAKTITHEMLHNMVRRVGGRECNGKLHTCEGFLSYNDDTFLSDPTKEKLNSEGFADPVYPKQMNATDCEDAISDPQECGVD